MSANWASCCHIHSFYFPVENPASETKKQLLQNTAWLDLKKVLTFASALEEAFFEGFFKVKRQGFETLCMQMAFSF